MLRDVSEEVPADAVDRLELGLIHDQWRELLPGGAQRDEMRLNLLTGEGIDGMDAAVEYDRANHVLLSGAKDLTERPYGDLGDDALIELPDLRHRPGYRLDCFAGLDVPECLLFRDDLDWGQIPLHSKQGGFGHVTGAALGREISWVWRCVEHSLDVFADGKPIVGRQPSRHLIDAGIMGGDLAFLLSDFLLIRSARLDDLPTPLCILLPVALLGPRKLAFCSINGRIVSLLTAEHPPQAPRGLGLEVLPLRRPKRNPELAKV